MEYVTAFLKLVPLIVSLWNAYTAARQRGIGHDEAVAEGLQKVQEQVRQASVVTDAAVKEHDAKPDDAAFDGDFKR